MNSNSTSIFLNMSLCVPPTFSTYAAVQGRTMWRYKRHFLQMFCGTPIYSSSKAMPCRFFCSKTTGFTPLYGCISANCQCKTWQKSINRHIYILTKWKSNNCAETEKQSVVFKWVIGKNVINTFQPQNRSLGFTRWGRKIGSVLKWKLKHQRANINY